MTTAPNWADHPDLVDFYATHRNRPEDLYASEARFLPWLARQAGSVLDTGCAVGGFSEIWSHFNPDLSYTGVDVSASLVAAARQLHPRLEFVLGNVSDGLPLRDRYADVVQALGWLPWEPRWDIALDELWRLTGRWLFLDVRVVADPADAGVGRQRIELVGEWDGKTETPYVTVAWPELARRLAALRPAAVYGYGYWGHPSDSTRDVPENICLATFVLTRGDRDAAPSVCLDLPLAWPDDAAPGAEILPPDRLAERVPQD
jgi:SAM-dependent methyltransferase